MGECGSDGLKGQSTWSKQRARLADRSHICVIYYVKIP